MEAILGADQTIDSLVDDILDHYDNYRSHILTGKAMIVAYSRPIAMKIYKRIMQLRPHWKEKVDVVMTQSNKDPEEWRQIIGNKSDKDNKARSFKDNKSKFKIAIVVDMWLTGFDVPSLATMYVFKPMVGHNLMQAIARVNRVFQDKEGGLVVDYIGIAKALKEAMNEYTSRDKSNYGNLNIKEVAYPKFLEKLEICQDIFHGYNYSPFISGSDLKRAKIITGGVNFLLEKNILEHNFSEERKSQNAFIKEALLLKQALSLCGTLASEEERLKAAFFEAVRTMIVRITMGGTNKKFSLNEINERINELLKQSIKSEGVINLFSDSKKGFSLFDPKFLDEIAKMKEKNLAIELLKKLIADQVANYRRTNLVKSKKFSELIQETMNRYINGMITNEEVIDQLVKLAHEIKKAIDQGNELGLTPIELAFYDALTQPQACKDFYHNDELIALTRELTDTLRKNRTVDWTQKSTARAGMRMMVKKLLKKYKYPPEGQEEALDTVIKQCELWADNNSDDFSQIRADIDRDDDDLETNLVATPPVPHNL
jgi:type I restriction enzyme R subunit